LPPAPDRGAKWSLLFDLMDPISFPNNTLCDGLPAAEVDRQRELYLEWWRQYGPTHAGLAWNKGKQGIRFDALLSFFDLPGRSFLDVGCGFGDLNKAIQFHTDDYAYHGVDIVDEYLTEAAKRYATPRVTFQKAEFLASKLEPQFDIGIASGTFNFRMAGIDQYDYLRETLTKMLAVCREGVAVDMLSDQVNFQRESSFYYSPSKVMEIAFSLTKNVALRHDFQPFEFAVALYKDDSFHNEMTVFHRHLARQRPLVEAHILS
jgi:SAM-dependent methyltransferase